MKNDDFDRLLDEALASYSKPEPPPGFEQRVLRRVHAESAKPTPVFPRWAFAAAAMACLAVVVTLVFWLRRDPPQPNRPEVARTVPKPPAPPVVQPAPAKKTVRKPRRPALPKRDVFPTPSPMTAEERALLEFFERAPEQAREVFVHAEQRRVAPIQIEEITIQPLQSDELQ